MHLLQESIFEEIVAESLPQLIIQAINQTMNKEWTTLGYISIIMSVPLLHLHIWPRFIHAVAALLPSLLVIVIAVVVVAIHALFRSSLMALNGVYRFLYFFLIKKIPIKEVPSGLEEYVFDVEGVELGKYALQLPPPSDNKVVPVKGDAGKFDASSAHQTVDLSSVELQPLISRIDAIDEKVDSKFSAIDSRFDGMDAKLAGILQALQAQTASPVQTTN